MLRWKGASILKRRRSLSGVRSPFSMLSHTLKYILDCPEHTHTSPAATSSYTNVFPPLPSMVSLSPVAASRGLNSTAHSPSGEALAFFDMTPNSPSRVTFTFSPAFACPLMTRGMFLCRTMPSVYILDILRPLSDGSPETHPLHTAPAKAIATAAAKISKYLLI